MVSDNDTDARRKRLKALNERRNNGASPVADHGTGSEMVAPGAASAPRQPGAGAMPAGEGRAAGGQGGQFGRARARQFVADWLRNNLLHRAGANEKAIPGTLFTEEGVRAVMQRLRSRAATRQGRGAGVAERIIQFITQAPTGDEVAFEGINLNRLRRVIDFASGDQSAMQTFDFAPLGGGGGGGGPRAARPTSLRAAVQPNAPELSAIQSLQATVMQLTEQVRSLSTQLNELKAEAPSEAASDRKSGAIPGSARPN